MRSAFALSRNAPTRFSLKSSASDVEPSDGDRSSRRLRHSVISLITISAAGLLSAWLYYWAGDLHRFTQWVAAYLWLYVALLGLCFVSSYVVWQMPLAGSRGMSVAAVGLVIVFGMFFRAELVPRRPFLSTDIYRYIWDGRVQAAGINPYRYVPDAEALTELRDNRIFPNINRGDYALTPYPPVAQALFLAVYLVRPSSVAAFKIAMSLFDLMTMLVIALVLARAGLEPARVVLFAWNPLLIFEGAHSGHIESIFIAFLAIALLARTRHKAAWTGVMLALATAVKFYPALVVPAFFFPNDDSSGEIPPASFSARLKGIVQALISRQNLKLIIAFVVTIILVYLPYLTVGTHVLGNLPNEFAEEGFTGSGTRYFLLDLVRKIAPVPTVLFLAISAIALLWLGLKWLTRKKRGPVDISAGCAALVGLYLLIITPRYPWYYAWIIPWLCFVPKIEWLYMTAATVLLYLTWYKPLEFPGLPLWLGSVVFLPPLLWLAIERYRKRSS